VLWPQGWSGGFDAVAALLTVAAAVALWRLKRGVIEVIAVSAAIGLVVHLLR
jgi:chromate transporter